MGGFFYHDYFCLAPVWYGLRHRAFIAKSPNKQLKSDSATPTIPATTLTKWAYVECQQIPRNLNRIWTANKIEALFTYGKRPAILWNPLNGIISCLPQRKNLRVLHRKQTHSQQNGIFIYPAYLFGNIPFLFYKIKTLSWEIVYLNDSCLLLIVCYHYIWLS